MAQLGLPQMMILGGAMGDASYAAKGIVQFQTDAATSGISVTAGVARLADTIVAAGPVGDGSTVPVITFDSKGRLTTVSTAAVNDTSKLSLAGGTMTGPVNMGLFNITNATSVAANNFSGRNLLLTDSGSDTVTLRTPNDIPTSYTLTLPLNAPTNGYVLSSDATGQLSWIAAATGSVTSVSATAPVLSSGGATPVISLDTGLSASKIPQVGGTALAANGVVVANGLGTALSSLNCAVNQVIKFDASGFAVCGADTASDPNAFLNGGNSFTANATLGTNDAYALNFETQGTTKMTVLANGNVGIGTTTPSYRFDVEGTAKLGSDSTPNYIAVGLNGIGIGTSGGTSAQVAQTKSALTGSGNFSMNQSTMTISPSVATSANFYGSKQDIAFQGSFNSPSATATGFHSNVKNSFSSRSFGAMIGLESIVAQDSAFATAPMTDIFGVKSTASNTSSGGSTVTNIYGLYSTVTSTTPANTGNAYGVYVGAVQGAAKYSLYASNATAPSYFAGNVGFGTSSPSTKLHVSGSNFSMMRVTSSAVSNTALEIENISSSKTWSLLTAGSSGSYPAGNFTIYDGNARLSINNAGNVGIGTTTPGAPLDVRGAIRLSGLTSGYTGFQPAAIAGSTVWTLPSADGSNNQVLTTNGAGVLSWSTPSGGGITSLNGLSGSTQTFANGTSGLAPAFSSVTNIHTLNIPLASGAGVTSGTISKVDYDSFAAKQAALGYTPLNPANNLSDLANAGTARTNLGLGTAAVLNVGTGSGNIIQLNGTAQLPAVDGSLLTGITAGQIPDLDAAKITTGTLAVSRGGTGVGIFSANQIVGTNSSGNGLISFTCGLGMVIKFDVLGNAVCGTDSGFADGGNTFSATATIGTNSNHNLEIETNGTTKMTVLANGNVGVGTTTPDSPITIQSSNPAASSLKIQSSSTNQFNNIMFAESDGAARISIQKEANNNLGLWTAVGAESSEIWTQRMTISTAGNVGIGSIAPTQLLELSRNQDATTAQHIINTDAGSNATAALALVTDAGAIAFSMGSVAGGGAATIWNYANSPLYIGTNNTARMTVLANGNVGIGTTSPQANSKLQVNGTATSLPNIIASGASVDLSLSNIHYLKSVGGSAITLSNIASGGSYTIIITDLAQRTYTFSGCTNSYFSPVNGETVDRTTYSIMTVVDGANTECFITWVTGYAP